MRERGKGLPYKRLQAGKSRSFALVPLLFCRGEYIEVKICLPKGNYFFTRKITKTDLEENWKHCGRFMNTTATFLFRR